MIRWKQCVTIVNKGFGLVAAHLYVTKMAADWTNAWVIFDSIAHGIAIALSIISKQQPYFF